MSFSQIDEIRKVLNGVELQGRNVRSLKGFPMMTHAFFPGGNGLYAGCDAKHFPVGGVLVLGSNFGCDTKFADEHGRLIKDNELSNPTWTGLLRLLHAAGIDPEHCFFTNAWPVLHTSKRNSNDAPEKKHWLRDERLMADARKVFRHTLHVMRPALMIALGPAPAAFLASYWPDQLLQWTGNSIRALDKLPFAAVPLEDRESTCVAITHPCRSSLADLRQPPYRGFAGQLALLREAKNRSQVQERLARTGSANIEALGQLLTESRNPRTMYLDQLSTLDMLTVINDEDAAVALAVRAELANIAAAVDAITERFGRGGRLFYVGAGTSGRLGVLDASECPPTFSVPPDLVQGLIAGGDRALRLSSEHSEDSPEEGARDLAAAGFAAEGHPDTLVGIAASGRTPYVLGAITYARSLGAVTIGLSCVPGSALAQAAELAITPATGPEVLTGSTRLKAGTATKLVLNMLSTGVMVRTGATFGNLMVNVRPTNAKLVDRAERILMAATGCDRETAARRLVESGNQVKLAIAMQLLGLGREAAAERLARAGGVLARALQD